MEILLGLLGLALFGYLLVVPGLALARTLYLGQLSDRLDRLEHEVRRLRRDLHPRPAEAEEAADALPAEPPSPAPGPAEPAPPPPRPRPAPAPRPAPPRYHAHY